jgi:hypothetical protein
MIVMRCDVERPGTLREDHQGRTPPTSCEPAQRMLPRQLVPGWRLTRGMTCVTGSRKPSIVRIRAWLGGTARQLKEGSLTPTVDLVLTEVRTGGRDWWTLGFEATGPPICSAANSRPPPRSCSPRPCRAGVQPGPAESSSYAQWLSLRPGADSNANTRSLSLRRAG